MTGFFEAARRAVAVCGAVVALDQGSKAAVQTALERGERVSVIPGLALENVRNRGVAFGLFGDVTPALIGLTVAVAIGILLWIGHSSGFEELWLPAGLIVGGALGNLADRVRMGSVTDFIDFPLWPSFNLADIAIVAGVIALVVLPSRSPP